ncbi:unnamed protein product, partial [marine sediment metagenome]
MPREEITHSAEGHKPLGQVLLEKGEVTQGQLDEALALQQRSTERLGQLLSRLGHVDAQSVREALVSQAGLGRLDIDNCEIHP